MQLATSLPLVRLALSLLGVLCFSSVANCFFQGSVPDQTRPRPESFSKPVIIEFHDEIHMRSFQYFNRRMDSAEASGADLIVIDIDSPGGLRDQSLLMARRIRDCKTAYTVVIVNNQAISGGALMALGCDEIHIDPNARFGDIGEIAFDAERFAWRLIEPKIESYLSRDARDLAESKGRSPDLAESMIDSEVFVYSKDEENADGVKQKVFQQARADAVLKPGPPWELIQETGEDRFLTVSGQRALQLGIAQGTAFTREALAEELNFDLASTTVYQPTAIDGLAFFLQQWWAKFLLILIGLTALYFELSAPGISVGGIIATFCAVLFFWGSFVGGTAGALEIILFLAGITFLAMEIFVIPGFGVSGITGLALLLFSVVLAGQDYVIPTTTAQINQTFSTLAVVTGSGLVFIVAAVFITRKMGSIPVFNQIILDPAANVRDDDEDDDKGKTSDIHPAISVGDWGVADSVLRPAGRAKFAGRTLDVVSDGTFIDPGSQVRVIEISGNVITVSEVEEVAG